MNARSIVDVTKQLIGILTTKDESSTATAVATINEQIHALYLLFEKFSYQILQDCGAVRNISDGFLAASETLKSFLEWEQLKKNYPESVFIGNMFTIMNQFNEIAKRIHQLPVKVADDLKANYEQLKKKFPESGLEPGL